MIFRSRIASFCFAIFILALSPMFVHAQSAQTYWIFFNDKDAVESISPKSQPAASAAQSLGLSARAVERRMRTASRALATFEDIPLSGRFIHALERESITIRAQSRWLNAVSAKLTEQQRLKVMTLPFVRSVERVRLHRIDPSKEMRTSPSAVTSVPKLSASYGMDYGYSLVQNEMIRVPKVHDVWIDGTGVFIGMNDNGFRWRVHDAMKSMAVVREYDFIKQDSITEFQPGDPGGQDGHGTLTLSTVGGFKEGMLIGPAFNATFELAKTEVMGSERMIEEDYWVQGLEWHERNGVDIVSSSLGYNTFDDTLGYSFDRGEFDGRHAITSRAAGQAARFGVLVVNSMGNEGNAVGSILAPADADSILAAGAVASNRTLASFSSIGPTNDNRIKPDVCAMGVQVFCATRDSANTYMAASGTSLSCPLVAGVAALVLSARSDLTAMQAREAVMKTASQASSPNNRYGYGIVDAWEAMLYHGMVISSRPRILWTGEVNRIAAYILSKSTIDPTTAKLFYSLDGASYTAIQMTKQTDYSELASGSGLYVATLPKLARDQIVRYYIEASDARERRTMPYNAPTKYYTLRIGESFTLGTANAFPLAFALGQNFPNPILLGGPRAVTTTTIRFDLPAESHVVLDLFDALGRKVATIFDGMKPFGSHAVTFNANMLSSGVYFYRLSANGRSDVKRMAVLR